MKNFNADDKQILSDANMFLNRHSANFNAETVAALREARDISEGKIIAKSFNSVDELMKDLLSDDD